MLLKDDDKKMARSRAEEEAKRLLDRKEFEKAFEEIKNYEPRSQGLPNRTKCDIGKIKSDTCTEKRLCRCLYYTNTDKVEKACDDCPLKDKTKEGYRNKIVGDYKIVAYEYVPINKGKSIGNVDIILADDNYAYLTEVKRPTGNSESLLRMLLEIETYYRMTELQKVRSKESGKEPDYEQIEGIGKKELKKAILFFKGSIQDSDYHNDKFSQYTKLLLKDNDVTVFCAEVKDNKVYIEKVSTY